MKRKKKTRKETFTENQGVKPRSSVPRSPVCSQSTCGCAEQAMCWCPSISLRRTTMCWCPQILWRWTQITCIPRWGQLIWCPSIPACQLNASPSWRLSRLRGLPRYVSLCGSRVDDRRVGVPRSLEDVSWSCEDEDLRESLAEDGEDAGSLSLSVSMSVSIEGGCW